MAEQPPQMMNYAPEQSKSSGMAIAAMVLGIVSLALFCVWYVSVPCAIIAIALGVVARKKVAEGTGGGRGMATAGLVCGTVSVVLVILAFAGCMAFLSMAKKNPQMRKALEDIQKQNPNMTFPTPPSNEPRLPMPTPTPPPGPHTTLTNPALCTWQA